MQEAREVNLEVRKNYNNLIEKGIESSDLELRRLIAEAYLAIRLNKR